MVRNNIISMSTVIREAYISHALKITYAQLPYNKRMVYGAINKPMTTTGADSMQNLRSHCTGKCHRLQPMTLLAYGPQSRTHTCLHTHRQTDIHTTKRNILFLTSTCPQNTSVTGAWNHLFFSGIINLSFIQ